LDNAKPRLKTDTYYIKEANVTKIQLSTIQIPNPEKGEEVETLSHSV